jgi:hypothetical protein
MAKPPVAWRRPIRRLCAYWLAAITCSATACSEARVVRSDSTEMSTGAVTVAFLPVCPGQRIVSIAGRALHARPAHSRPSRVPVTLEGHVRRVGPVERALVPGRRARRVCRRAGSRPWWPGCGRCASPAARGSGGRRFGLLEPQPTLSPERFDSRAGSLHGHWLDIPEPWEQQPAERLVTTEALDPGPTDHRPAARTATDRDHPPRHRRDDRRRSGRPARPDTGQRTRVVAPRPCSRPAGTRGLPQGVEA